MRFLVKAIWTGITLFLLLPSVISAQGVENELQIRTELELIFKPLDDLKLSLIPQLRFDDGLSLDRYHFEAEVEYDFWNFLEFGVSYRFVVNPRESNETEYLNRYAFNLTAKKEYGRFEPSFRLRYSNYTDDDVTDKTFMRYKASLKYDIKKCKLTPMLAVEAFQPLSNEGGLYKLRYTIGGDYKIFDNNYLGLHYKLDYYNNEYRNRHIISLGYKIKF